MNKEWLELEALDKALKKTHQFQQPCWYTHCLALETNLEEYFLHAESSRARITVKTPAQSFRVTPINIQYK